MPYFVKYGETWDGTIDGLDNILTDSTNNAGFINGPTGDYTLAANSSVLHLSEPLHAEILKQNYLVQYEYLFPASGKLRDPGSGNQNSLGAFEMSAN
jgi:hypothetical protein